MSAQNATQLISMMNKNSAEPVHPPRSLSGYEYKVRLSKQVHDKLTRIATRSERDKQHLTKYLVDYAIRKGYPESFRDQQRIHNPSDLRVFSSPHWWDKMKNLAWEYNTYRHSPGQFAGQCITAALRDHRVEWWTKFFYAGKDLEERALNFLENLSND